MADAVEAFGKDVDEEAADELGCGQAHDLLAITALDPVVLPAESHGAGIGTDQSVVRDRDPVGVTAQIGQHGHRPAEGRFGIDHPVGFAERGEPLREGIRSRQAGEIAKESELACTVQLEKAFQEQAPEQPRQYPHMQEEPWLATDPFVAVR